MVDYRLDAARKLGADVTFSAMEDVPARLREANNGRLADLVIVCTGALPALRQALESVERGGTVLFFAPTAPGVSLPVPINDVFFRNDVTLTTTYAGAPADLATAMDMIASGRVQVGEMISHRLGLAEAGLGFKLTADAGDSLKVIIQPQK
jgi:L-iditol 2-dehydrogenase